MDIWEDALLERKLESDLKDLLKTIVAFANSVRPGHIATIIIGERDDGSVQGVSNPDQIQMSVRKECEKVYPPVIWRSLVYTIDRKQCVKVEVEFSGDTPHFGGPAWIRKGSESIKASDELFQQLINIRSAVPREIAKWLNKIVSIQGDVSTVPSDTQMVNDFVIPLYRHRWPDNVQAELVFVNSFWITLKTDDRKLHSEPLEKLTLSYDDENNRLKLLIKY